MSSKSKIQAAEPAPEYEQARKALAQMEQHKIAPTPDNYKIWYMAACDENSALAKEIRQIVNQKVEFTPEVSDYLRNKYIPAPEVNVSAGADEAKEALAEVMKIVNQFSGETAAYNAKIDQQTSKLTETATKGTEVGSLLKEIVGQLQDIRTSGANFNSKLASSRKEIETLRTNLEKATAESRRDFLTGIPNRRAFDEVISELTEASERQFKDLCLLMIDIDHFKKFNDTWGHQTGDEVLKVVAKALGQNVRGSDVVARYGGEEFALLLPGTPLNGALVVAENVRKTIAASKLKRRDSQDELGQITVSIGVARFRIGEGDSVPFLIKRADEALYSAKKGGRNKVVAEL